MAKTIQLSSGELVTVDDHWFPILNRFPWHKSVKGYAQRSLVPGKSIMMHQVIAMTPTGMQTDHVNGDKLDNQESNLRICTNAENSRARTRSALPKSGFIGVVPKPNGKFEAKIMADYKAKYLGVFDRAEDAAKAYDQAARELHGEFAKQNFQGPISNE